MSHTEKTIPGTWYTITSTAPATVTQQIAGQTATLATLTESGTATFRATATTITIETTGNYHILPTKAPAAGNLSSGGNTNLTPADIASLNQSAADIRSAIQTLEHTPNTTQNNTYTATNTFNGALVANGSLLYGQQELGDLLTYPVITRLAEAGINPVSALARTWDEWVALNPNWSTLENLLFYAPLIQGSIPELNTATSVSSCTYISPALTANRGCNYLLSRKFNIFTLATHGLDAVHCYNGLQCYYCAPRVTQLVSSLNAFATSSTANTAELSVFTPELTSIVQSNIGNTFRKLGTLKTFSIYAPKLVTSFCFADASGSKAQYCSVLHSLVAGIGTPVTMQTITTLTPLDNTDENISALRAAAAEKKWKFILPDGTDL